MSPITISYSESDAYRQCALKHHLAYVERWRTTDSSPALARGTALHAALEAHYKALQARPLNPLTSDAEFLTTLRSLLVDQGLLEGDEADEAVAWMYDGYHFYGCDNAWEILAVEVDFDVPLYDRDGTESGFRLHGRIDLIVRNRGTGKIFVVDHKTCSNLPTAKALEFDEQMALYTIAGRRVGYDIYGAIYNAIRSKKLVRAMTSEERFSRTLVTKTDYELSVVEHELVDTMRDAYRPREADPPRSPDSDRCNWKCNYREACIAGRKLGPKRMREFLHDTGFRQSESVLARQKAEAAAALPMAGQQMDLLTALASLDGAAQEGDTVKVIPAMVRPESAKKPVDQHGRPLSSISMPMRGGS